tara:strand:+ start:28 stop:408 length:381 start_codon:yes stop_codon:yes gene_type:complete
MQNAIKLIRKPVLSLATIAGVLGVLIMVRTMVDGYNNGSIFSDMTSSRVGVLLVLVMIALAIGIVVSDRECNANFNKGILGLFLFSSLSSAMCVPLVFSYIDFDLGIVVQEASGAVGWVVSSIPIP